MKASKERFFSEYWVENRHEYLTSLPVADARHLLQTFTDKDIESNVNSRTYQHSYICDFLKDVWAISHRSFWNHIRLGLTHPDGIVIADNDFHLEIMKTERMPSTVFDELLNTIPRIRDDTFFKIHLEIALAQIENSPNFAFLSAFKSWYSQLSPALKSSVRQIATNNINNPEILRIVNS